LPSPFAKLDGVRAACSASISPLASIVESVLPVPIRSTRISRGRSSLSLAQLAGTIALLAIYKFGRGGGFQRVRQRLSRATRMRSAALRQPSRDAIAGHSVRAGRSAPSWSRRGSRSYC
jgi:hypothetical protein